MTNFPVGEPLPADQLAKRATLPLKPSPVTLEGRFVRLQPLDVARDAEKLFAISNGQPVTMGDRHTDAYDADALIWRYMAQTPFTALEPFTEYLHSQANAANALCLTVVDIEANHPVGIVNFMNNAPEHLKIELGGIWYSPIVQRTPTNTEATYLMLDHAFTLGYRRVEWKCDSLNARSRRAAERMGFIFEGIQEAHFIIKGRNRDTAWFRILASEWAGVKAHLERLLYASQG